MVVDGNKVEEFDFESENKRQLAGNIYLAKVTRVEPSLQAAFVDYGGNRHGFLAFSEIHPDYYQIPVADREALMAEERAYAEQQKAREEEDEKPKSRSRSRGRSRSRAAKVDSNDAVEVKDIADTSIDGMETIDLGDDDDLSGLSPMETVRETPVETPAEGEADASGEDERTQAPETDAESDIAQPADTADDQLQATATQSDDMQSNDSVDAEDNAEAEDIDTEAKADASDKDETIESVADEDDEEDIRPVRKPRPRRYKIQEVVKVRQILLVQVVKEERGNKGAALTTYLSLAGRYCVLMPNTARGGGISRKITNAPDRKKLKEIANEIDVPQGAGLIIRTAGAKRTKTEIKRDYEYLQRLWEQIRELTLKSIAPAKIYEEGDLIKRSIRDLYNRDIDEVFVEGERGYRIAKDFMKMIMPSHAKNVKLYNESMPLFARYQVESYLSGMFNPTVQLKSGGYIVIGVTEALVAIDVNSGRATKEGSIEETATKTNLEAAEEVARQLRLRDLAGLIVIDFIDMDERKNNAAVEKRIKDKLKTDRARIQVGRISGFGLMEMSRQRLRPGMIEATTAPCPSCHGTGLIRSDDNLALSILRQIEEEGTRKRSREVLVKCPVGIANFLMNQKREHIAQIEQRYGMSVRIEGDHMLVSPDFTMEKFKTATRAVPVAPTHVVSVDTSLMDQVDEDAEAEEEEAETTEDQTAENTTEEETKPKKRRRRRRRKKSGSGSADGADNGEDGQGGANAESGQEAATDAAPAPKAAEAEAGGDATTAEPAQNADAPAEAEPAKAEKPKRTRSPRKPKAEKTEPVAAAEASTDAADAVAETEPKPKPKRTRKPSAKKLAEMTAAEAAANAPDAEVVTETPPEAQAEAEVKAEKPAPKKRASRAKKPKAEAVADAAETSIESAEPTREAPAVQEGVPETAPEMASEPAPATAAAEPISAPVVDSAPEKANKPKKKGWWNLGRS